MGARAAARRVRVTRGLPATFARRVAGDCRSARRARHGALGASRRRRLDAVAARARRRPHDRERAAAGRRRVRVDASRLRRRLRVLHDGPRRAGAPPDSAEIVAQVALARARRRVRRVVFMGMGEPAHNLDNVLDAITLLGTEGDLARRTWCSPRSATGACSSGCRAAPSSPRSRCRCTRPTPSCARNCCRARRASTPRSSWSSPTGTRAPPLSDAISMDAARRRQRRRRRDRDARELLAGNYAVLNFIPYNNVDGAGLERPDASGAPVAFRRPAAQRAEALIRSLHGYGILAKLRRSAGQDVEAGCGQLRARTVNAARTVAAAAP